MTNDEIRVAVQLMADQLDRHTVAFSTISTCFETAIKEIEARFEHIVDKLNRVEADVAHQRVVAVDPAVSKTETAVTLLERVIASTQAQNEEFARIAEQLRNGR